jgi:hypothetical protein
MIRALILYWVGLAIAGAFLYIGEKITKDMHDED